MRVDDTRGPRWGLALDLIESGGEGVTIENVLVQRCSGRPGADERVHVSVFTEWEPQSLSEATAQNEVQKGCALVNRLLAEDERLRMLCEQYGTVWDYRHDYGMGAIVLAEITQDGDITWRERPRSSGVSYRYRRARRRRR